MEKTKVIVVADAGPIIYLDELNRLNLHCRVISTVLVFPQRKIHEQS